MIWTADSPIRKGVDRAIVSALAQASGPKANFEVGFPVQMSTAELMSATGHGRDAIITARKRLIAAGWMDVEDHEGGANVYRLSLSTPAEIRKGAETDPTGNPLWTPTDSSGGTPTDSSGGTLRKPTRLHICSKREEYERGGEPEGVAQPPSPSVVPSPSLDDDGLHPWERADAVDDLGWPIEADETKEVSDDEDRSSGDGGTNRSGGEPDRGASRGIGDDAQGGRSLGSSGRADGCEGDRAGESDSTRADAIRARAGVVDPMRTLPG